MDILFPELMLIILRLADDPAVCRSVCRNWRSACKGMVSRELEGWARMGYTSIIRWAIQQNPRLSVGVSLRPPIRAAEQGHLRTLKLFPHSALWYGPHVVTRAAAENGHLPVMRYMLELNHHPHKEYYTDAAKAGHTYIIKWLYFNGHSCPGWDFDAYVCAAQGGHLDTLKFLWSNSSNIAPVATHAIADYARECGHEDIAQWILASCAFQS